MVQTKMRTDPQLVTGDDALFAWEAQLAINLFSAGQTWFNIDTTSLDSLSKIVQYKGPAGYAAGGICALLGKSPVTFPVPLIDSNAVDSANELLAGSGGGSRKSNPNDVNNGNGPSPITNVNNSVISSFSVFPNPTYGNLTTTSSGSGTFYVYTVEGQLINQYPIIMGSIDIQLPNNLAPGVYMGVFKPDTGSKPSTVQLIYQP